MLCVIFPNEKKNPKISDFENIKKQFDRHFLQQKKVPKNNNQNNQTNQSFSYDVLYISKQQNLK